LFAAGAMLRDLIALAEVARSSGNSKDEDYYAG
jgi:hypothetical protein